MNDYLNYGYSYFDNKKIGIGYAGYKYDKKYEEKVKEIINFYNLKKGDKVLEVGCAKGFLLVEFFKKSMKVFGIDNSSYAKKNSHPFIKNKIKKHDIELGLPYKDNFFDFVICKEVLPHIKSTKINFILKEIKRVVKDKSKIFLEIQSFKKNSDVKPFKEWDPTHKSCFGSKKWIKILKANKFNGDCNIKFLF